MSEITLLKATHEGIVPVGEKSLKCAVLNDGTRVLSVTAIFKAFDRPARGNARLINVPVFMDAKNLQSFIGEDLRDMIIPIHFIELNGNQAYGYNALLLPKLCKMYLDARASKPNKLKQNQLPLVRASEILLIGLANRGILDLIDKATGYTYDEERKQIDAIVKLLVSDEILEWQQAFHLSFYREIFRLWNIPFTEAFIKRKPQFIGHLTNTYIYKNLPKGVFVLAKLKEKTPKTKGGFNRYNLHRSLTPDKGREALKKVIYSVEALASISENKNQFIKYMNEKYGQTELKFEDVKELNEPIYKETELSGFNKSLKTALDFKPKED
ncbi:MAG TPA: P63C domain-containing protein [Bacteroidia bacterium]